VSDDEIRELLLELGRVTFGTPEGFIRVPVSDIAPRADLPTIAVWIANHGGLVEGTDPYESRALGQGRWERTVQPAEESFLIPRRALDAG
jgi:hypothetical protein